MNWPNSQDYNEAIQNPSSFADPELKGGAVEVNAIGLPVPRSGNFADVYKLKRAGGTFWAVKCFTRKVGGLQERYAKISEHLAKANFPFTVGFQYLEQGIRVRGQWFPVLKMEWVEGFTLNEFVRDNAARPQYLHALTQMWAKLCGRLRDGNFAHADLQHGNVLLVPATSGSKLQLRLIDYDGMWVPALADTHSGEVGHPNFQHPLRLKDRLYTADVDRFPHLVIAAALRATLIGGKPLFDRFDNGDNLLFKEGDLRDPANSQVFKALWGMRDDVLCTLVGKMALASREPLRKTPWLDDVLLGNENTLSAEEEKRVVALLGVEPHFTASKEVAVPASVNAPRMEEYSDFADIDDGAASPPSRKARASKPASTGKKRAKQEARSKVPLFVGAGVAAAALVGLAIAMSGGKKDKPAQPDVATDAGPRSEQVTPPAPKKKEPVAVVKKEDPPKEPSIVEKVDPPAVAKIDPPAAAAAAEPVRLWKRNYSTHRPVAFNEDGASMFAAPAGEKMIEKLATADGSRTAKAEPFEGVANFVSGPAGTLWVKDTRGKKLDRLTVFDANTLTSKFESDDTARITKAWPHPDGKSLVCLLLSQKELGVFSVVDGSRTDTWKTPAAQPIVEAASTPGGGTVALLSSSAEVFIKSTADADWVRHQLDMPKGGSHHLAVSRERFALVMKDNVIQVFDSASGKPASRMSGHGGPIMGVEFAADPRVLVSASQDGTMRLWDVATGDELRKCDLGGRAKSLTLSPDGTVAAVPTNYPEGLQAWRLQAAAQNSPAVVKKEEPPEIVRKDPPAGGLKPLKQVWKVSQYATAAVFSPDGKQIATDGPTGGVRVYDVASATVTTHDISDQSINRFYHCGDNVLLVVTKNDKGRLPEVLFWDCAAKQRRASIDYSGLYSGEFSLAPEIGKAVAHLRDGGVGVFSLADGSLVETVQAPRGSYLVQWTPGGETMIAGGLAGNVLARSDRSGPMAVVAKLGETFGTIPPVCLSPDGKHFAAYKFRGSEIGVFDAASGERRHLVNTDDKKLLSVAFTPDGQRLLAAFAGLPSIGVWDVSSGRALGEFDLPSPVRQFNVSPDGRSLVACLVGDSLGVWQIPDDAFETGRGDEPPEKGSTVTPPDTSKKDIVAASFPQLTFQWGVLKRQTPPNALTFSQDGSVLALYDARAGALVLLDAASGRTLQTDKTSAPVGTLLPATGKAILARTNSSQLFAWDLEKKKVLWEIGNVSDGAANSVIFNPETNSFYMWGYENAIGIIDAADGSKKGAIPRLEDGVRGLKSSGSLDHKVLVTLGAKDPKNKNSSLYVKHPRSDWKRIAGYGEPRNVRLAVSPDGKYVAVGSTNQPIKVYETADGKLVSTLAGHSDDYGKVRFTPDGRMVVSVADDKTLRTWDHVTGKEIQKLALPNPDPSMVISPDGRYVAVVYKDEVVQVFKFSRAAAHLKAP